MTAAAVIAVEGFRILRDHADDPGLLVGIHVEQARGRVVGRAAPFGAAVGAGEEHGAAFAGRRVHAFGIHTAEFGQDGGVRFRGAVGDHVFGEGLAREGRGLHGVGLGARKFLAFEGRLHRLAVLHGEERFAGFAVQHVDIAGLGDLRDGIDVMPVPLHGDEAGGGGKIEVPGVVTDALEVPDAFAGAGVEGEHAVGEEVVSNAVGAVEIEGGRAGGGEDHAEFRIDGEAGPGVRAAGDLPGVFGPGFVAELAGPGDGVEDPAKLAGFGVPGADMPGRARQRFGNRAAEDDHVLKDHAGAAGADTHLFGGTAEAFAEIDLQDGFAGLAVEGVEEVAVGEEDAILINGDAAVAVAALRRRAGGGVEGPDLMAGGGVERDNFEGGRGGVENAADDDRIALHLRVFERVVRIVRPRDLELGDVGAVDLCERRKADVSRPAVDRPLDIRRVESGNCDETEDQRGELHSSPNCSARFYALSISPGY